MRSQRKPLAARRLIHDISFYRRSLLCTTWKKSLDRHGEKKESRRKDQALPTEIDVDQCSVEEDIVDIGGIMAKRADASENITV